MCCVASTRGERSGALDGLFIKSPGVSKKCYIPITEERPVERGTVLTFLLKRNDPRGRSDHSARKKKHELLCMTHTSPFFSVAKRRQEASLRKRLRRTALQQQYFKESLFSLRSVHGVAYLLYYIEYLPTGSQSSLQYVLFCTVYCWKGLLKVRATVC